ncbi:MAG TPA: DUF4010 domain-containing protein, partial [Candidatus Aquilonibacter sp.]
MNYLVLLGLALFYGFAFEDFYGRELESRPGGVRTFPLLAFAGAVLWLIDPAHGFAFIAGLLVLGAWLYAYVRDAASPDAKPIDGPLIVPVSVLLAYALGPAALVLPLWIPAAMVVGTVLLLGSRKALHALVARVPEKEMLTLGQFLLLVGVVLPLLYHAPRIPYTQITPFSVWLAVVAVSTLSYVSYLLQRYVLPKSGVLVAAALGGMYSSTAATVVLARSAHDGGVTPEVTAGIIAATAMMYVRILVVVAIFNRTMALRLTLPLLALGAIAAIVAAVFVRRGSGAPPPDVARENPLRLGTAVIFAVLLIAISVLSKWVQVHAGAHGVFALAAVVGVTDIDP